jgi:hypothetical protein
VPISESYFVQALLQQTLAQHRRIEWTAKESEGFRTEVNGVMLELDSVATRSGPRLYLTLGRDHQRAFVEEPVNLGFFHEQYGTEGEKDLAALLRELFCAAAQQCVEREVHNQQGSEREALFRRALFGNQEEQPARPSFQPGLA